MNNLQKKAFILAESLFTYLPQHNNSREKQLLEHVHYFILEPSQGCEPKEWTVPFIQRQRYFELIHYYWLCLFRGIEPTH